MKLFLIILFLVCLKVKANDTLNLRVLYHPHLDFNHSIHKRFSDDISKETEYFFKISYNKIQLPGFSVHDSLLFDRIDQIFDTILCDDINKTVFWSKKSTRYYSNIGHLRKNYYSGLVFYAFDIKCIIDSAKTPLSVLDFSPYSGAKMVKKRDVKVPTIVKFLEINPVPLRKHKLKKNGKIYPVR